MITYEKILKIKKIIQSKEIVERYRISEKYFTRMRKIKFSDIIYFTLNKRGLSLKMEMNKFEETTGLMEGVTESALCQQRKKIDPELFKELNRVYIKNSYEKEKEYKRIKGYIVTAIDGMKIEVPNVKELKEEYGVSNGTEKQRKSARALTSCIYDIANDWVIDAQITNYNGSERELAKKHIMEMISTIGDIVDIEKVIIIFDRGYPSIEMIYMLNLLKIKYVFRSSKSNYTKEIKSMRGEDEEVEIEVSKNRITRIEDEELKEMITKEKSIKSRFVKYKLETGETEIIITNLKEEEFSTEEIGELYYKRWNIELAYNIAKNKLEIENFSGQSKIVVEQEFYGQMLMLNIAQDLKKEANEGVKAKKENGYKYDYAINMNALIGRIREKFIKIVIEMIITEDKEKGKEYDKLIEEIRKELVPIRPNRKNPRKEYKGYNKYKQNHRRNS